MFQLQAVEAMIFHQEALPCGSLCEGWRGCVTWGVLLHRVRHWVCPRDIGTSSSSWALMGHVPLPPARCERLGLVPGCMCTVTQTGREEVGCLGSLLPLLLVTPLHAHSWAYMFLRSKEGVLLCAQHLQGWMWRVHGGAGGQWSWMEQAL